MPACGAGEPGDEAVEKVAPAFENGEAVRWKLPEALDEISGLALDTQNMVYAVADEQAAVFKIDPGSGKMLSVFSFDRPALRGDFEGIALLAGWLYLITSDGTLVRTKVPTDASAVDGSWVNYERFELPTRCEIEGLDRDPEEPWLWIACKKTQGTQALRLYAWNATTKSLVPEATRELPVEALKKRTGQKRFKPSGIAFTQIDGDSNLVIISGAQRAWSVWHWTDRPRLRAAGRLPKAHKQAEGIAFTAGGDLLLADEGGKKSARLRIYSASHSPVVLAGKEGDEKYTSVVDDKQ